MSPTNDPLRRNRISGISMPLVDAETGFSSRNLHLPPARQPCLTSSLEMPVTLFIEREISGGPVSRLDLSRIENVFENLLSSSRHREVPGSERFILDALRSRRFLPVSETEFDSAVSREAAQGRQGGDPFEHSDARTRRREFFHSGNGPGRERKPREPSVRPCFMALSNFRILAWLAVGRNWTVVVHFGYSPCVNRFSTDLRSGKSSEPDQFDCVGKRIIAAGRLSSSRNNPARTLHSPSMPDSREQATRYIEGANSSIGSVRSRCSDRQIRAAGLGAPDIRSRVGGHGRRRDEHGFSPVRRPWFVRLDVRRNREFILPDRFSERPGREFAMRRRENRFLGWSSIGAGFRHRPDAMRAGRELWFHLWRRLLARRRKKKGGPKGPPSRRMLLMDQKLMATPRDSALFSPVLVPQAAPEKTGLALSSVRESLSWSLISQIDLL